VQAANGRYEAVFSVTPMFGFGRGRVKTKTDFAVNQFCKIQTSKSRRIESSLGFLAHFAQFAKAPRVFTRPP
jgi:hypothetical protein